MRRFLLILALAITASTAQAVEFWHSSTAWAGQGMCAAEFTFDSGGEPVRGLKIAMSAADAQGNPVDAVVMTLPDFGDSNADRYITEFWESEAMCDDGLVLTVTLASALVDDQQQNLLKTGGLAVREFKPFVINLTGAALPAGPAAVAPTGVECDIPMDKADAESRWALLQSNPSAYLKQCVEFTANMAMEFGGIPKKEAQQTALDGCRIEMNQERMCMAQPGARAESCFCAVDS